MEMKTPALVGVLLLLLGVAAFAYPAVSHKSRETIVDAGPIKVTTARERPLPLSPVFGVAALTAGTVLVIVGLRKRPVF